METGHYIAKINKNMIMETSANIIVNINNKPLSIISPLNQVKIILLTSTDKY